MAGAAFDPDAFIGSGQAAPDASQAPQQSFDPNAFLGLSGSDSKAQSPSGGSSWGDYANRVWGDAKSVARGAAEGAADFAGLPGDVGNAMGAGINWAAGKAGLPQADFSKQPGSLTPSSQQTNAAISPYLPQGGDSAEAPYMEGGGRFLGNPLNYAGPGGVARNLAGSAVADAAGYGASKTAQAAGASPGMQAAAGLGGSLLAGGVTNPMFRSIPDSNAKGLMQAAGNGFNQFRAGGAEIPEPDITAWAKTNKTLLEGNGLDSDLAPTTHKILDGLQGQSMGPSDITALNSKLSKVAGNTQDFKPTQDAVAATKLKQSFNNDLPNLLLQKPTNAADLATLAQAKRTYAAGAMAQNVDDAAAKGVRQASKANSGMNVENRVRSTIDSRLGAPYQQKNLTPAQQDFVNQMIQGSPGQNALRTAGNMLGGGGGIGAGITAVAGGHLMGLDPLHSAVGMALPVAGMASKALANKNMVDKAKALSYSLATGKNPKSLMNSIRVRNAANAAVAAQQGYDNGQ